MNQPREDAHRYDDIINLPHHTSSVHPQMPIEKRAAQFSPFEALTGYGDAVAETARWTDRRVQLDEDRRSALEERLQFLLEGRERKRSAALTWFIPDERKSGGRYVTHTGVLRKFDALNRVLVMEDGTRIPVDEVTEVHFADDPREQ